MQTVGIWGLREEARKSWDHVLCDDLVYFAKPFDVNGECPHVFAEKYVGSDLWLHIRWAQVEPGEAGNRCNEALIEAVHFDEPFHVSPKLDSPIAAVNGNGSMFVEIPELIELPERFRLCGIRSVARLKRVKDRMDDGVEQSAFLPISRIGSTNWKDNLGSSFVVGRNRARKQVDQVPSKLVETSAEAVNEVPNCESNFFVRGLRGDYENMKRSIRIVFFGDRIRVALNPISKLLLRRLEVKVSPSGFHIDILN